MADFGHKCLMWRHKDGAYVCRNQLKTAEGLKYGGMETTFVTPCPMRVPAQIKDRLEMFNEVEQRSLGGCFPPTDETGLSKLRQGALVFDTVFDNGTLTSIDDNGIFEDVKWVPEIEESNDDDYIPEHFYDCCSPSTSLPRMTTCPTSTAA